jgi:hypothetical protein
MYTLIFKFKNGKEETIVIKYLSLLFEQIVLNLPKIKEHDIEVIIKIAKENNICIS